MKKGKLLKDEHVICQTKDANITWNKNIQTKLLK